MTARVALLLFALLAASCAAAPIKPGVPEADRIRLAEAFRISQALGHDVWQDWDAPPFAVLLVTAEHEFLIGHPRPSKDFTLAGHDPVLASDVYYRKRTQPTNFLATFPAVGGISTIVIGQAENTAKKTSTAWVVTVLHERFHQLQAYQPAYYEGVEALGLSRGDQTGMWMLNFPFPYRDAKVIDRFSGLSTLLAEALRAGDDREFPTRVGAYLRARRAFRQALSPDDYRYFSFQLWQEGIARYTEYRLADLAGSTYTPSEQFRALKDYVPFRDVADAILQQEILAGLPKLRLEQSERVAFYPFGAAEGLLLDRAKPGWRTRYFKDPFSTGPYFADAR